MASNYYDDGQKVDDMCREYEEINSDSNDDSNSDDPYEEVVVSSDTYTETTDVVDKETAFNRQESRIYVSKKKIRIAIIGRTGSGKSSLGNTILTTKVFKNCHSPVSITANTKVQSKKRNGIKIFVADTPGLFHTSMSESDVKKQMLKCIEPTSSSPDVFLYTMKIGRYSHEELKSFSRFTETFGDDVFNYTILVFTGKDYLEKEDIAKYVKNLPTEIKKRTEKVNNRMVAFNNFATGNEKQQQWDTLLNLMNTMIKEHSNKPFCANIKQPKLNWEQLKRHLSPSVNNKVRPAEYQ